MKKYAFYNFVNIVLGVVYILVLVNKNVFYNISTPELWFPLFVTLFGISLVIKAVLFKSDSALWFGLNAIIIGIVILLSFNYSISFTILWPVVITSLAFSFFVVGICFKDWLCLRLAIGLMIVSVSCYLYSLKIIELFWFIILEICSIIVSLFVSKIVQIK